MKKNKSPKLKIPYSKYEIVIEVISLLLLIGSGLLLLKEYEGLPEIIPVHFNFSGQADGWGPKAILFILPGSSLFIYLLTTITSLFPHGHNYIVKITEQNARIQYKISRVFINIIKCNCYVMPSWKNVKNSYSKIHVLIIWDCIIIIVCSIK